MAVLKRQKIILVRSEERLRKMVFRVSLPLLLLVLQDMEMYRRELRRYLIFSPTK